MPARNANAKQIVFDRAKASDWQRYQRRQRKSNRFLTLANVVSVTPAAAEILLEWDGCLDLDGLPDLPADVAHVLGGFRGRMSFGSLTALTEEAAGGLAKHNNSLALDGLPQIPPRVAKALVSRPTPKGAKCLRSLSLKGLQQLPASVAKVLARYDGELILGGQFDLSPEVAEGLAAHTGQLTLDVGRITDAAAEALSRHRGFIWLPHVRRLTDAAAAALAKHLGGIRFGICWPEDGAEAEAALRKYRPAS